MKFVIVEAFTTGDKNRFGMTGYLTNSTDAELDLIHEIVEAQKLILQNDKEKRKTIKLFPHQIKYCKISIDSCKLILDMFRDNFGVDIDVVLDKDCVVIPESCRPLVKTELRRLER